MEALPTRHYVVPVGDEPLDDFEQAIVRMWIDILVAEFLDDAAAGAPCSTAADVSAVRVETPPLVSPRGVA